MNRVSGFKARLKAFCKISLGLDELLAVALVGRLSETRGFRLHIADSLLRI